MMYCPYCGASLAGGAASFCAECGKEVPIAYSRTESLKEAFPQTHPGKAKKAPKSRKKRLPLSQTEADDGYDGYYDDVSTEDGGHIRAGLEPGLIKRVILLCAGVVFVLALAVLAMYFL